MSMFTRHNVPDKINEQKDLDIGIDLGKNPFDYFPEFDDKDDVLIAKINKLKEEAEGQTEEIKNVCEENYKLIFGDHIELMKQQNLEEYRSDTVINRLFPAIRSFAGFMSDSRPKPEVLAASANDAETYDENKMKAKMMGLALDYKWEDRRMRHKSTRMFFRVQSDCDVFLKPFWNYDEDDVDAEVVFISDLYWEPGAKSIDEAGWVIQTTPRTMSWARKNLPKEKLKLLKPTGINGIDNLIEIQEFWTDEFVVIKHENEIIDKYKNPYFEEKDEDEQYSEFIEENESVMTEMFPEQQQAFINEMFKPVKNYFRFKKPKKPFIHFESLNFGDKLNSENTLKQVKKVLFSINKRKQQIDDNANSTGNTKRYYDNTLITEEEANKITGEPNQNIGLPGDPNRLIREESGRPIPNYVVNDLIHTERCFDDIFGWHEISRGTKGRTQTATEAIKLSEADQVVVRFLGRNFETVIRELYEWWIQMMCLFYTEDHIINISSKDAKDLGIEKPYFTINSSIIDAGASVVVKPGSAIPVSKSTERNEAMALARANLLSPQSLYEKLEWPDAEKHAIRFLNFKKGIISDEQQTQMGATQDMSQAEIADMENQAMMRGQRIKVSPKDDNRIHIKVHEAFMQSQESPPEVDELINAHIEEHIQGGGLSAEGTRGEALPSGIQEGLEGQA